MDLALSTDAKPRLKWTPVLHQRFIEAVTQLGGAERATPKSLMRVMGVPGLTLYHLKSHLQKYRLGKNQQTEISNANEDYTESDTEGGITSGRVTNDESLDIEQTLQKQMEVQNKLHEQIEVQKHLQLRIEAQGVYLQSILKKAQETLAGYNSSSSTALEATKTEVSELVSLVETGCLSSTFSDFTNTGFFLINRATDCSVDSSLTSCGRKNGNGSTGRKRSGSTISDESSVEQPQPPLKTKKLDLNCKYESESVKVRPGLDLNCPEPEMFHEF